MKRLFFAIDIAAHDKQAIATWRDDNLDLTYRAIPLHNFHITLAFLGMVASESTEQLIDATNKAIIGKQTASFALHASDLGIFCKPQVLFLSFSHFPKALGDLAQTLNTIAKKQGIAIHDREYHPHLSIYRKAKQLPELATPNIHFSVSSFSLYHSFNNGNGVEYQPIETWSLVQI